jgi:hypothetical protein
MSTADTTSQQPGVTLNGRSKWAIFTCVAIAQFMVVLDTAIISVALPIIKHQLHFSNSGIQWVVTAYVLTFGGFLLLGGRMADLFGRRRMLLIGMIAFTACSRSWGSRRRPGCSSPFGPCKVRQRPLCPRQLCRSSWPRSTKTTSATKLWVTGRWWRPAAPP